jgi:hypothetical protein
MKINLILSVFILTLSSVFGQVKSVSYDIKFNAESKEFDVYLIINEGNALSSRQRIQFNSQVSVVVPNGSSLVVSKSLMPLIDNSELRSNKPLNWSVSNSVKAVKSMNNNSIFSVSPNLTSTSFYNELNEKDNVKLFSVAVSPIPSDLSSVRIFNNEHDASSKELFGGDFSNGFTMGNVSQLFKDKEVELKTVNVKNIDKFSSSIYPNPAVDKINLTVSAKLGSKVVANVFDINGQLVMKNVVNEKISSADFSLSLPISLNPGLYTISVDVDGSSTDHKFVVVK